MTEVNLDSENFEEKKKSKISKKPIAMNTPMKKSKIAQLLVDQNDSVNDHYKINYTPDELKQLPKSLLLKLISLPAKERAVLLNLKLNHSRYVNDYLNTYFMLDFLSGMNDHLKFIAAYGINFIETILYNPIVNNINEAQQKSESENKNN